MTGTGHFPRKLLIKVVLEIPHLIQNIAIALGCQPELDGGILLMNKPQFLVTRGEIKLVLIAPLPFW